MLSMAFTFVQIQFLCIAVRSASIIDLRQHLTDLGTANMDLLEKMEQKERTNSLLRQQLVLHHNMSDLSALGKIAKMSQRIERDKVKNQELSSQLDACRSEVLELRQIYEYHNTGMAQGGHPCASIQPPLCDTRALQFEKIKDLQRTVKQQMEIIDGMRAQAEATTRDVAIEIEKLKVHIDAQNHTIFAYRRCVQVLNKDLVAQQKQYEFVAQSRLALLRQATCRQTIPDDWKPATQNQMERIPARDGTGVQIRPRFGSKYLAQYDFTSSSVGFFRDSASDIERDALDNQTVRRNW